MNKYKFCPNCKNDLQISGNMATCNKCGFTYYLNPAPTVAAIPIKDGKFLAAVRKIDPFKGELDLIGGFVETDESLEEAVVREVKEETGLDVKITNYFKSYPDYYGGKDKPLVGVDFIVEIIGGKEKADDDVSDLKWINIKDIPNLKLNGFENIRTALNDLYNLYCRG